MSLPGRDMGVTRLLLVPALVGIFALLGGLQGVQDKFDHVCTIGMALRTLLSFEQADFDAMLNSYDVFDNPQSNSSDEVKVNAVYKVLVPLMALGSLTKYYIPPVVDPTKNSFKYLNHNQVGHLALYTARELRCRCCSSNRWQTRSQ